MTEERVQRRLATILAADVVGYSRLMGRDEEATLATLKSYREAIDGLITGHDGRIFGGAGDSVIAEFASPVEAVRCAAEIQLELEKRNTDLPEPRRMRFRIGINLGDVMIERDNLLGDGVNIAARLEGLADAGGICVSGAVHEQVRDRVDLLFADLGEQEVKNIDRPVRVWRWVSGATTTAGVPANTDEALLLPDKPSIAVLAFENMSGDAEQDYFVDGIAEDIITALSKLSDLFVIARNSSFAYRGRTINAIDICRELGVRNLLEGSVRKVGDRVRITAQLIDGTTGGHLWAERFDRQLKHIFDVQDEVTEEIVSTLEIKLTPTQRTKLTQKDTTSIEAHDYLLRGRDFYFRHKRETNLEARAMFERAAELDPASATAVAAVGATYLLEWNQGWSKLEKDSLSRAHAYALDALKLDDTVSVPHWLMGYVHLWQRSHDLAIAEADRAIALDPNDSNAYGLKSMALSWAGRPEEALAPIDTGTRLDPRYPAYFLFAEGQAYFGMQDWTAAIDAFRRCIGRNPDLMPSHAFLAASLSIIGGTREAQESCSEILRLNPGFTISDFRRMVPYKRKADLEHLLSGLSGAGLPE